MAQPSLMPQMSNLPGASTEQKRPLQTVEKASTIISNIDKNIKSQKHRKSNINSEARHQDPIIQNLVSTADLNIELDLKQINLRCGNTEYNPKRFAAVISRLTEPRTTALIFKTGKMVITGAKSPEKSKEAARIYVNQIGKALGKKTVLKEFKI